MQNIASGIADRIAMIRTRTDETRASPPETQRSLEGNHMTQTLPPRR